MADSLAWKLLHPPVLVALIALGLGLAVYLLTVPKKRDQNSHIPPPAHNVFPIIGAYTFFVRRWDWFQAEVARSKNGLFSFYAGNKLIIGISGEEARKIFFESKGLDPWEGYSALLGGTPAPQKSANSEKPNAKGQIVEFDDDVNAHFKKSLIHLMKPGLLASRLPDLTIDVRTAVEKLMEVGEKRFEAYDSIFDIIAQMVCRTVGCNELANDAALRLKYTNLFKDLENSFSPMSILYSWLPVPGKIKRYYAGLKMYLILRKIVDNRQAKGIIENDALQYRIDQGASIQKIINVSLHHPHLIKT